MWYPDTYAKRQDRKAHSCIRKRKRKTNAPNDDDEHKLKTATPQEVVILCNLQQQSIYISSCQLQQE